MGMEMMDIETTQPTVEELQVQVGNLTTRLEKVTEQNGEKDTLLLDTVRKIADLCKEAFQSQGNYPDFVQEVYERINYPVDSKWLEWAAVERDVEVELTYEVSVGGYVGLEGNLIDLSGDLDNVTVKATLSDVPGEIQDVTDIDDVADYSDFEQSYELSEGSLTLEFQLVEIVEQ